ncbi:MAG: KilA-N domain-containing protein [Leptospira sp.]|nr:KilA-N domain-containing protein [Leptospira sp.]
MTNLFLEYQGNEIHYTAEGYINVTHMAKIFGKRPADFFAFKQAEEYVEALADATGIHPNELKYTVQGGNQKEIHRYQNSPNGGDLFSTPIEEDESQSVIAQGTFCHPKLAIRFAQWLNPKFAVWVDGKILEILGYTNTKESTELLISRALIAANDFINHQKDQIRFLEARAKSFEDLTETSGLFSFSDAARILNFKDFGEKKLFDFCRKKGLLTSNNKPYGKFLEKGFFEVKIVAIKKGYARSESYPKTHITSKGIAFIRELLLSTGEYYPNKGAA